MAQAIIASITDTGRANLANLLAVGRAFRITSFVTGEGGHDPGDPAVALTPDPTVTALPSQSFGPKAISSATLINPFCVEFLCSLGNLDAVGSLSNIGLIATFTYSPIPSDPLVGTTFLYAVGNFPLQVKTDAETKAISLQVQY
jgi:hypothetical protein